MKIFDTSVSLIVYAILLLVSTSFDDPMKLHIIGLAYLVIITSYEIIKRRPFQAVVEASLGLFWVLIWTGIH